MTADGPGHRVTVDRRDGALQRLPLRRADQQRRARVPARVPAALRRPSELRQPSGPGASWRRSSASISGALADESEDLVRRFFERSSAGTLATDQLLNAVYLCRHAGTEDRRALADRIMPYLTGPVDDD